MLKYWLKILCDGKLVSKIITILRKISRVEFYNSGKINSHKPTYWYIINHLGGTSMLKIFIYKHEQYIDIQLMITSILWVSDLHTTGFATVAKSFIHEFIHTSEFRLSLLAINHNLDPAQLISSLRIEFPFINNIWSIVPAKFTNTNGESIIQNASLNQILGIYELQKISKYYQPDIIFFLNDEDPAFKYLKIKHLFPCSKFIMYMPLDCGNFPSQFFKPLQNYHHLITVTKFSAKQIENSHILYHPLNPSIYRPLNKKLELRQKWTPNNLDDYIIINVNMNQLRKRFDKTLEVFDKFHNKVSKSLLILKTKNISIDSKNEKCTPNMEKFINDKYPHLKSSVILIDKILTSQELNELYNLSDLCITTTIGEGWGYTPCEALLAGIKVLVPNHTSFQELFHTEQTYRATATPWIARDPQINNPHPCGIISYATFVRSIKSVESHSWELKILDDMKIPAIIICQFGEDTPPTINEPYIENDMLVLAKFKTFNYTLKYLNDMLSNSDYPAIQIRIQFGVMFEYLQRQLANKLCEPIMIKNYDVYQLAPNSIIPFIAHVYIPDTENCFQNLIKIYNEKIQSQKVVDQQRDWMIQKCDIKMLHQKLVEILNIKSISII